MTRHPTSTKSVDVRAEIAELAALHSILLPEQGTDRCRALVAAEDCFRLARFCASEREVGEQFLALAASLPTDDGAEQSQPAPAPPERARKPRKPTLASVAKQASKAALDVARYEVKPDGTLVLVIGQGEQQQGD